jgi:hypothetical protein
VAQGNPPPRQSPAQENPELGAVIQSRIYNHPKYGPMTLDKNGRPVAASGIQTQQMAQMKLQQQQEQQRLQMEAKRQDAEAKANKQATNEINALYRQELKTQTEDGGEANPDKAWEAALVQYQRLKQVPSMMKRQSAWESWLSQKYAGVDTNSLRSAVSKLSAKDPAAQEISSEIGRRTEGNRSAPPREWEPSVPVPHGMSPVLKNANPEFLDRFRWHALNEREFTQGEFRKKYPKQNYAQYRQFRKYIQSDPQMSAVEELRKPEPEPAPSPAPKYEPVLDTINDPEAYLQLANPNKLPSGRPARKSVTKSPMRIGGAGNPIQPDDKRLEAYPRPATKAEYDALQKGAMYIHPDGTVKRKK